jgi:integrase
MSPQDYDRAADIKNISADPPLMGRALRLGEIAAIMAACTGDSTPAGARDAAMVAILRGTGLRRSEVVALNLTDFDSTTGELQVKCGKGRKARTVYLPKGALFAVLDWLKIRGTEPGALLCPVHRLGTVTIRHMTSQAVLYTLQKRGLQAGIASFSPHDFRRTFCSDLLDAGVDVFTVQKLAGHSSPVTTAKYDRRGEEAKKKAVEHLETFYPHLTL